MLDNKVHPYPVQSIPLRKSRRIGQRCSTHQVSVSSRNDSLPAVLISSLGDLEMMKKNCRENNLSNPVRLHRNLKHRGKVQPPIPSG